MTVLAARQLMALPLAALVAMLLGALVATQPLYAVALVALAATVVLAFAAPVAHLTLLLVVTAIVPHALQNKFGLGGGTGAPGLVVSDALLLTGLARGAFVLAQRRLAASEVVGLGLTLLFLGVALAQFVHGVRSGAGLSIPGDELRKLWGLGALLVALPILKDPDARPRLLKALLGIGLLLGLWGVAQWSLQLPYEWGVGVREGVGLTTSGRGQVQGGLYAFPVAVVLAFAALVSGGVHGTFPRTLVIACMALNAISVLLTFERTFWVVTVLACVWILVRANPAPRARAIAWTPVILIVAFVSLAFLAPATLTTAQERLLSLGQYSSDSSVSYRVRESQQVLAEIRTAPLSGSGLGASVWWGRPDAGVPPEVHYFAHNGYLWAAWKLGIPAAVLLFGGILVAILRPGRVPGEPMFAGVALGAQAALLALIVAAVTFPGVASRTITAVMGVLLAFCLLPRVPRGKPESRFADHSVTHRDRLPDVAGSAAPG